MNTLFQKDKEGQTKHVKNLASARLWNQRNAEIFQSARVGETGQTLQGGSENITPSHNHVEAKLGNNRDIPIAETRFIFPRPRHRNLPAAAAIEKHGQTGGCNSVVAFSGQSKHGECFTTTADPEQKHMAPPPQLFANELFREYVTGIDNGEPSLVRG
ncbi:hypothetical protein Bbelb_322010 [Branchiostoma belcheri]|nr:hypothetical protein Bbelb_322010 [Branchiostoma belcheri]